jgi:hypothetical protein
LLKKVLKTSWLRNPRRSRGAAAVLLHERSDRAPVLAQHQLGVGGGAVGRIAMALPPALDEVLLAGLHRADVDAVHPRADRRIGERLEPVGRLHHVRIGIVDDAVSGVGHEAIATTEATEGHRDVQPRSASTSTRASLKQAPPPMSVSASGTSAVEVRR